ncbi:MAG: hypothetical protein M9962_14540 [Oligoflexia bacterium]|nr:hypothetical protein [Oligoflexia bacterium]
MIKFDHSEWQISPFKDLFSYHFSWLYVLIPMLLSGMPGKIAPISAAVFIFVVIVNFFHRHITLVYAYFDPEVFHAYRKKILIGTFLVVGFFSLHIFLVEKHIYFYITFVVIASLSLVWNFWHVLMQKFGIFRMYAVKAVGQNQLITPAYIDRFFIFCWVPLFLFYVAPKYQQEIFDNGRTVAPMVLPLLERLIAIQFVMVPFSIFIVLSGVFLFYFWEWRVSKNILSPRAIYGLNLIGLYLAFVFLDPLHAYVAFGFNHAFEYLVFIGAFWKKKYQKQEQSNFLFAKVARSSFLFLISFFLLFGVTYFFLRYYGVRFSQDKGAFVLWGFTASQWLFYWSVYESMLHFHMDGYLWKMKRKEVVQYI